jgi:hypothetical protein
MYFIILMSGDIELNPGPNSIYPCEYREIPVTWEHQHIAIWYHSTCLEYSSNKVELLQRSNVSWICCKCDSQNIDSFTFHSFEFEISNFSSVLSTSCTSTIPSIDLSFSPTTYSSPKPHIARMKSRLNTLSNSFHTISQLELPWLISLVVYPSLTDMKAPPQFLYRSLR